MYVVRTVYVFPKQKEESVETAVASSGDFTQLAQLLSAGAMRNCRQFAFGSEELLFVLKQQLPGFVTRSAYSALPRSSRQAEGPSTRNAVTSHRRHIHRRQLHQQQSTSGRATKASAHGLCIGAKNLETRNRRGAACNRVQNMAMARSERCQRHQKDTHLPKCRRSLLHLLQSDALESHGQYR